MATPDADPEFLALSDRQRRQVDRAFSRGLRLAGGRRPAKRRKVDTGRAASAAASTSNLDGGGFVDDGGGFIDDGGGGGFLPDNGGGFVDDGGGFLPDDGGGFIADDDSGGFVPDSGPSTVPATPAATETVPLRFIPALLSSLSLPADDDVLAVFRASASGWDAKPGEEVDPAVGLKDFRAVCAALMEPEEDDGEAMDVEPSSDDGSSDNFELSELSDAPSEDDDDDDDGEYGRPKPARRTRRTAALEVTRIKLNPHQREMARDIWGMLKPTASGPGSGILGRDEVKRWARELGEMWSDDEITDMVQLFSSQHEGRGLTFEDFGIVMVRAGLV
ncbi:uncharacterized protein LOC62_02G002186 [Vanrija pseudolonga]|uniref:EF-hand domain-containing protein n=1 Tax=Vanrija pseudolonga TaxID=143232 RepID=A0AAF0Y3C2_9TREE|nr:hypothetical protein LOC62_02G002186 [Vanrija pseudolonga]